MARNPKQSKKPFIPRVFDRAIFEEICAQIADGKSLFEVLKSQPGKYPSNGHFFTWVNRAAEAEKGEPLYGLADIYARAQLARSRYLEDEIIHIADNPVNMEIVTKLETEETGENAKSRKEVRRVIQDALGRSTLRVDTRKWVLARMDPARYHLTSDSAKPVDPNRDDPNRVTILGGLPD